MLITKEYRDKIKLHYRTVLQLWIKINNNIPATGIQNCNTDTKKPPQIGRYLTSKLFMRTYRYCDITNLH